MTLQHVLLFAILAAALGLFVWGRLRYDLVAVLALLATVVTGIVPMGTIPVTTVAKRASTATRS